MTIIKYRPGRSLWGMPRWMNDLDDDLISFPSFSQTKGLHIHETETDIVVEAVVAGVPKKDVEVEIENGVLTIKAEAKEEEKTKGRARGSYILIKLNYGICTSEIR